MGIFRLQTVQPIDTETRPFVTMPRVPDRYIRLICKIITRPVGAIIINHKKVIDAHITVILQKIRKPDLLIAQGRKQQDIARLDPCGSVRNRAQFPPFTPGTYQPALALQSQTI